MVPNGWNEYELHELCIKPISYGIVQTGENIINGIPCIRVVDLTTEKMRPDEMIKTSHQINKAYQKTILEKNDIVMALRGEVGLVRIIESHLIGANITRGLARISARKEIVYPKYLLWQLRSPKFRTDLIRRVGGSALQEISLTELRKVKSLVPPLAEQQKIAQILSTWDKAIAVTEQLLANSQQQKKALMQQLLTGKKRLLEENGVRFEGEWRKQRLGSLLKEGKERNKDNSISRVLSVTNHSGFVLPENQFSKRIASDEVSHYKVVRKGQYGYNPSRINVGSFARLDQFSEGLLSPMYIVFSIDSVELDSDFFLYWMQSNEAQQRINNSTQGSVRDSVGFDAICSFLFKMPSLEEQKKISAVISASLQEIKLLETKLDYLQQEKKALMQQLLTGKRRVKIAV